MPLSECEQWKIADFRCWKLYLDDNQSCLGRLILLPRRELPDIMDASDEEIDELMHIGKLLKQVLDGLFYPDTYSYVSVGSLTYCCHVHVVPRYRTWRDFADHRFFDTSWGNNFALFIRNDVVDELILATIRDAIRRELQTLLREPHNQFHPRVDDRSFAAPGDRFGGVTGEFFRDGS